MTKREEKFSNKKKTNNKIFCGFNLINYTMTHTELITIKKCEHCEVEDGETPCFLVEYITSSGRKDNSFYEGKLPLKIGKKIEVFFDGEVISPTKNNSKSIYVTSKFKSEKQKSKDPDQILLEKVSRHYDNLCSSLNFSHLSNNDTNNDDSIHFDTDVDSHHQSDEYIKSQQEYHDILLRLQRIDDNYNSLTSQS